MSYAKNFSSIITVYPEFYKDPFCEYLKEKINKWISDCFTTYNSFFKIKVTQHSAIFYEYNSEKDKKDINLKKLWTNPYGCYSIYISGAGILHNGISNSINPPLFLIDNLIDKITFKYKESSDIKCPEILGFGKNIGIPIKYYSDDVEGWNNGFCEKNLYCPNWSFCISCSRTNFDKARNLVESLIRLNENKNSEIDYDPYGLEINVNTTFFLNNKNKSDYLLILNNILNLVINDEDNIEILNCSMNFISQDNDDFSLESYLFQEIWGKFIVKNISIF